MLLTRSEAGIRVVYASYDGALDPLGGSQVVPYLLGLSQRGVSVTLVSFEKPERWADVEARRALEARLAQGGVPWRPLPYHRRPRVPATLWDVLRGAAAVGAAARKPRAALLHCRGDVAMTMARWARLPAGTRLIYEARGLLSDERVEVGSWRRGSLLDHAVRGVEKANLDRADGLLIVMSEAGRAEMARRRSPLPPHRVLPNSVDVSSFRPRAPAEEPEFGLVYCGSLGGWYMTEEMVAFAREASKVVTGKVLFLTPQVEEARRAGADPGWAEVRSVRPSEVPGWLRRARASFFFIRPTPAKKASSPTKVAEALATGLPVVANRGVGDLDGILEAEGVGVLVEAFSPEAYRSAAERLAELLRDPGTAVRCRRLAETRYSLESAVAAYHELYRELCSGLPDQ